MATAAPATSDCLAPISQEHPAGEDISLAPEWQAIDQARRPDKLLGRQNVDWGAIRELVTGALTHKSKDLRLAVWFLEASVKLDGFSGLRDGAGVLRGLLNGFWDSGLHPDAEGGDTQYRGTALQWLGGDNLPRVIREIPLTARTDEGRDCSYIDYRQSQNVGWEKDTRNSNGDADEKKVARRNALLAAGGVSAEMFEESVRATRRAAVEAIAAEAESAWDEFLALDKTIDEKFKIKTDAPGTSEAKEAIEDCRRLLQSLVNRKRQEEPDPSQKVDSSAPGASPSGAPSIIPGSVGSDEADGAGTWREAEDMVRQGKVREGLAQMTQLAAREYGRAHFQHRLRLAEICLSIKRERLAIAILEELAKTIDERHLESWESPELLGRVWGRLYRCYKAAAADSEQAGRAGVLFDKLCRLDPWQALRWDE